MTGVLTVGCGRPWESELVAALDKPGSTMSVIRRCADIPDLIAAASTGKAMVAIVDGSARRLDSETVGVLAGAGVALVAVSLDQQSAQRLQAIGIIAVVDDSGGAGMLVTAAESAMTTFAAHPPLTGSPGNPRSALPHRTSTGQVGGSADGTPTGQPEPAGASSKVVAVWGPTGAPGRSTLALGLADATAQSGVGTLLIDADVYGGVLASALGLLDESPGIAGACRLAANGRLDSAEFDRLCWQISSKLSVLTGISRPDRWPEVRPSTIPQVLARARIAKTVTVVDCGFCLETDEEISYDTLAPRRNGATLAILAEADLVLVVGSADPPGMERLIRSLNELAEVHPHIRPKVVLNRIRTSAASGAEAAQTLKRFTGLEPIAMVPEDRKGTDAAWETGAGLTLAAPGSPMCGAFATLSRVLIPAVAVAQPVAVSRLSNDRAAVADRRGVSFPGGLKHADARRRGRHSDT